MCAWQPVPKREKHICTAFVATAPLRRVRPSFWSKTAKCRHRPTRRIFLFCTLDKRLPRNRTALQEYVSRSTSGSGLELERMLVLLDKCSLSVPDTWLLFAARVGDEGSVASLLAERADPNVADSEGSTPLMRAISRGHVDVARALLDTPGIDVQKRNDWGYDAVIYLGSVLYSMPAAFEDIRSLLEARGFDATRNELRWSQKPKRT